MSELLKIIGNRVVVPRRHVIREHRRFKIYLPEYYNEIWEEINRQGKTVDVVIIVRE